MRSHLGGPSWIDRTHILHHKSMHGTLGSCTHRCTQLQVEVRLDALLGHCLGNALRPPGVQGARWRCSAMWRPNTDPACHAPARHSSSEHSVGLAPKPPPTFTHLGLAALKLACQQIAQPALQQGDNAAQEEEPNTPHGGPEAHARALAEGGSRRDGQTTLRSRLGGWAQG